MARRRKYVSHTEAKVRALAVIVQALARYYRHPDARPWDVKRMIVAACALHGMDVPATWREP
jgi:hypothetical protein